MTYADVRKTDPAIRAIIVHAASVNIPRLDIEAIEKILIEGADGRYLDEYDTTYLLKPQIPDAPVDCEHS